MNFVKTTSDNEDFKYLTNLFDEYLVDVDGDEKDFFRQFNQVKLDHVLVCYQDEKAVGCGAFKIYSEETVELKRMFVLPESRGSGIANAILTELETWAKSLNKKTAILETSYKLPEAVSLYKKFGYEIIPNYDQYVGVESSLCMQKQL